MVAGQGHGAFELITSVCAVFCVLLTRIWSAACVSFVNPQHTMPKSVDEERIKANLLGATLELTSEDVAELDTLEEGLVTGWDPVKDAPV